MDSTKIITNIGTEEQVNGIFYIFNSKYYFIYTTGELDDNGYVKLYLTQVGKEVVNTPTGPVDTGYMTGVEVKDPDEWKLVQTSISQIVEDKKNNTQSDKIQYLPISMLVNLKVANSNKFKLIKEVVENNFKITNAFKENENTVEKVALTEENNMPMTNDQSEDVILDYRTLFFEEQEKNKNLSEELNNLKQKIENVKNIIE